MCPDLCQHNCILIMNFNSIVWMFLHISTHANNPQPTSQHAKKDLNKMG